MIVPLAARPRPARRAQTGLNPGRPRPILGEDPTSASLLPMVNLRAAQAYSRIGVETGVASADPHRLVLMLYDGVLDSIAKARHHLAAGRMSDKGRAVSRAIAIVESGLKPALDLSRGGAIASQLDALYDYVTRRLLQANASNDPAGLVESASLLGEIREAWQTVADARAATERAA